MMAKSHKPIGFWFYITVLCMVLLLNIYYCLYMPINYFKSNKSNSKQDCTKGFELHYRGKTLENINSTTSKIYSTEHHSYKAQSLTKYNDKIFIYNHLCLTKTNDDTLIEVYNSPTNDRRYIYAAVGSPNPNETERWDIQFRNDSSPRNYKHLHAHAFFVKTTFVGNFYHFWNDMFDGLYGAMVYAGDDYERALSMAKYVFSNGDV